jgi:hypothetical protein
MSANITCTHYMLAKRRKLRPGLLICMSFLQHYDR